MEESGSPIEYSNGMETLRLVLLADQFDQDVASFRDAMYLLPEIQKPVRTLEVDFSYTIIASANLHGNRCAPMEDLYSWLVHYVENGG